MLLSATVAWQALRAFDHRSLNLKHAVAGPLFFFLLTASAPFLQVDVNARFQLGMLVGAIYTALAARELMVSETEERLSNRPFTYKWFGSMAALLLLAGIAAYVWPLGNIQKYYAGIGQEVPACAERGGDIYSDVCASFGHVFVGVRATHFGAVGVWCHDCGGWFDGAIARGYQHVVLGLGRGLRF